MDMVSLGLQSQEQERLLRASYILSILGEKSQLSLFREKINLVGKIYCPFVFRLSLVCYD